MNLYTIAAVLSIIMYYTRIVRHRDDLYCNTHLLAIYFPLLSSRCNTFHERVAIGFLLVGMGCICHSLCFVCLHLGRSIKIRWSKF